jgi:hypothetical protein
MVARLVSPLAAFQKRTLLQKAFHACLRPPSVSVVLEHTSRTGGLYLTDSVVS